MLLKIICAVECDICGRCYAKSRVPSSSLKAASHVYKIAPTTLMRQGLDGAAITSLPQNANLPFSICDEPGVFLV
jgi:hypothetical protein